MEALPQSYEYTVLTILESALAHDLNICHIRHTLACSPIQSPEYRPVHLQRQCSHKREHPIFWLPTDKYQGFLSSGQLHQWKQTRRTRCKCHCFSIQAHNCLLYTSDAADDLLCVDLGGRRIIKKKK